jgi:hypothetical protein
MKPRQTSLVACLGILCGFIFACAGASSSGDGHWGPECEVLEPLVEVVRSLNHVLDIIENNGGEPQQAAMAIQAYAALREPVTRCLRVVMPDINDRLDTDQKLLVEYARKVVPVQKRQARLAQRMPEMFADERVIEALKRLN